MAITTTTRDWTKRGTPGYDAWGNPTNVPKAPTYESIVPDFPTYEPYQPQAPTMELPGAPGAQPYPGMQQIPTYQPGGEQYPITQLPIYQPTGEAYPGYRPPETGGVQEALQESILGRITGAGTAGAESAIYERGEERVERQHEEGLRRIDEEMAARGLTGSGIHGEAVSKLETERQRSLADLSRQVTIYGQEAIESAMGRAGQYVDQQATEAARALIAREKGWAARTGEKIRAFESKAMAAQAKGQSEQAAYQTAIAERVKAYESQAKAADAKNMYSMRKWESKADEQMRRYQMELQRGQMLQQAKMQSYEIGREEYQRAYQAAYQSTRDRYEAERAAMEAAERTARFEWEKVQRDIETYWKRQRIEEYEKEKGEDRWEGFPSRWGQMIHSVGIGTRR